jgi:hypothetical protein
MQKGLPLLYQLSGVTAFYAIFAFIITLMDFLLNRSIIVTLFVLVSGLLLGYWAGLVAQRKNLKIIEEKGDFTPGFSKFPWYVWVSVILITLLALAALPLSNLSSNFSGVFLGFLFPFQAANYTANMSTIKTWQNRTHREILVESVWSTKIYASPPIERR